MSHQQTPFDHPTAYAAVARSGRVALVAFPLGQGSYNQGFWPYRRAFQHALGQVLPAPLLQTDAPRHANRGGVRRPRIGSEAPESFFFASDAVDG